MGSKLDSPNEAAQAISNMLDFSTHILDETIVDRISEFLSTQNDYRLDDIKELLSSERLQQVKKNLGKMGIIETAQLKSAVSELENQIKENNISIYQLAKLLAIIVVQKLLEQPGGFRRIIKNELKKVRYVDDNDQTTDRESTFTAYINKNAGSFLAKGSAGLCTSDDYELFNNPDHFHINMVREGKIVGNIQAYRIQVEGKPALLVRGFNPLSSFVSRENCEVICEQMVDVISQIAEDNQLQVFIPDQNGGDHLLSNRIQAGVGDYFTNKFVSSQNRIDYTFTPYDGTIIYQIYRMI